MSTTTEVRAPWTPQTEEERETVRSALREVLTSPQFCNSKRYPALLQYVVEQTLNGNGEQIKERTLGVEVFGRPLDYDTNSDTVVRYSAGEVRKRLALFYHSHGSSPVQIALSSRSYLPEFFRLQETEGEPAYLSLPETLLPSPVEVVDTRLTDRWRRTAIGALTALLLVTLVAGGVWVRSRLRPNPVKSFWAPILESREISLISPGGVVFSSASAIGTQVADGSVVNPFLSFENGLALGRVAAVLNARGGEYRVQAAASTTLAQITASPVILIGAYNNEWTQRLLMPLRFHFAQHPQELIVDAEKRNRQWVRDASRPYGETTDYAIVARFRETSTANMVVVLAGLQRFGTDAASQFVISPRMLAELDDRVGPAWRRQNLEVILKVDVVGGLAGAPQIEDIHTW